MRAAVGVQQLLHVHPLPQSFAQRVPHRALGGVAGLQSADECVPVLVGVGQRARFSIRNTVAIQCDARVTMGQISINEKYKHVHFNINQATHRMAHMTRICSEESADSSSRSISLMLAPNSRSLCSGSPYVNQGLAAVTSLASPALYWCEYK